MFENEMTFVKIDSEESEFAAIRRYATLKNYIRDRERRERLDNLEEAPTPRERRRLNDDLEEVSTPPPPPPPFEKGKKSRKNNNVSHNKNSTSGGSISSSTSNNSTAVTPTASIRQLSKRKNAKNSKTTSASQRNASSSSDVTPRRMKEVEKKRVSKNISNTFSSSEIGKKRKKASKKKILIKKTTSNAKKPRRNIDWGDERLNDLTYNQNAVENMKKKHLYTSLKPKFLRKNISEVGGGGVIEFLPSDVRSLRKQLTYLIGEYRAGNRSLRNKIAAILKNLHSRKVMTKREYDMEINSIFR